MDKQIIIRNKVSDLFEKLLGYVPIHHVEFKNIGRGIAGTAEYRRHVKIGVVTFDPFFYEQDFDRYLNDTVPHEVCHIVTDIIFPEAKQSHGREWRMLMRRIGADPKRCHNYSVENAPGLKTRTKVYVCNCEGRTFSLSTRMHNNILKGQRRYCKECKQDLIFSHIAV